MVQLNSFNAVRFRGIDGLSLRHLSKANLITGANGVGKTALIEAIWLFTGRFNPSILWNLKVQRPPMPTLDPISRLTDRELELHGQEDGTHHKLKWVFQKFESVSPSPGAGGAMQTVEPPPPTTSTTKPRD